MSEVREARPTDLEALLALYLHLHETEIPQQDEHLKAVWEQILHDPNYHLLVIEEEGKLVSSCVCVVVPNLTRGIRPCALIENVVTDDAFRRRGYAAACLHRAQEIARAAGCYKIMLMTGAQDEGTLSFYRAAGFRSTDKTAFVQWI